MITSIDFSYLFEIALITTHGRGRVWPRGGGRQDSLHLLCFSLPSIVSLSLSSLVLAVSLYLYSYHFSPLCVSLHPIPFKILFKFFE